MTIEVDVAVAGGGPAGLAAALAMARQGLSVALVDKRKLVPGSHDDGRTAALMQPSLARLTALGVWPTSGLAPAPLRGLRIINAASALGARGADVTFWARDLGLDAFGYNFPITTLVDMLQQHVRDNEAIRIVDGAGVLAFSRAASKATLALDDGNTIRCALVIATDGKASRIRALAGIDVWQRDTGQAAVTCAFNHAEPHDDVSIETHRDAGPLTTVPLPGDRSSLVWLEQRARAEELCAMDAAAFREALQPHVARHLGSIGTPSRRQAIPLISLRAKRLAAPRVALLGETAHAFSPIGAQGLNLTLRDVETLAAIVKQQAHDPGSAEGLRAYDRQRRPDVRLRVTGVDRFGAAVATSSPLMAMLRDAGLRALSTTPPARRALMRMMMGESERPLDVLRQPPAIPTP